MAISGDKVVGPKGYNVGLSKQWRKKTVFRIMESLKSKLGRKLPE
jgi:hypothetical protein